MTSVVKYQKYKEQSINVQTAGEQLVLVLEEACISLNKAIICIGKRNISGSHNNIQKVQNIYQYLIDSLDFNFPLSSDLFSLYNFVLDKLIQANLKKDPELLKWALETTIQLKDTWKNAEIISRTQGEAG